MSSTGPLTCQDEQRRYAVRASDRLNGLDYLEVEIIEVGGRQRVFLCVHFLGPVPAPEQVRLENIRIEGGERIRDIRAVALQLHIPEDPSIDGCLRIEVDKLGDFSPYILRLVNLAAIAEPGGLQLDSRYACLQFFFRAGCPSDLDCKAPPPVCPPEFGAEPEISYLAKDYASFRQLILDRLALIMPDWQERHVPDLGITLVEILAYVGDYLSYYQDAVATEAYLETARQRISVRRHVRLVDYVMHEGCNARTWRWLETSQDTTLNLNQAFFITAYPGAPAKGTVLSAGELARMVPTDQYEVFEPLVADTQAAAWKLYLAHNCIEFYPWGDRQCCLPQGATTATLRDTWAPFSIPAADVPGTPPPNEQDCDDPEPPAPPRPPRALSNLKPGDLLLFEEIKGAKTGNLADADFSHRHVVRLTKVELLEDPLYTVQVPAAPSPDAETEYAEGRNVEPPLVELPLPIVHIEWAVADALPFALCISAIGPAPNCALVENISVARGNVLLADHGRTIRDEDLGTVKAQDLQMVCVGENQPAEAIARPQRFTPRLQAADLTFSQLLSNSALLTAPAAQLQPQDPRQATPQITLSATPAGRVGDRWVPRPDLLSSQPHHQHFVVEMDNEGQAHLRFGDGELGQQPAIATQFTATYRVGSGPAGNLGAETLAHVVVPESISGLSITPHNPFPASGGTLPEPLSEVKLFAPTAFRKELQRAVTLQDYAAIVLRDFGSQVQRAAATLRWTGNWYEMLVVIDPKGTEESDPSLLAEIATHLERYRRMGHDVVVKSATYVFVDIAMTVCVKPDYRRGQVAAALLEVLSDRPLTGGQRGFFHPDNLTFGTGIALSKLVAVAQTVPGVESVTVTKLQRFAEPANGELAQGLLSLSALEIARLDNDPNFPERGQLVLNMRGGR